MNTVRYSLDICRKCLVLLLLVALTYSFFPTGMANSDVSILPSAQEVYTGDEFDIYIYIEPETPIAGAQLDMSYDSDMLRANSVDGSDLFEQDGTSSIFIGGTIDNSQGRINGLFAVTLGKANIASAENFAHVSFTALEKTGDCTIKLSNVILSDYSGNALPITTKDAQITIQENASVPTGETTTATGGGGGGGGGDTGEKAENIDSKEVSKVYVNADTKTTYYFSDSSNPVKSISYMSLKNAGFITSTIEILRDVSSTVSGKPEGIIYRNINIWVGKAGYATENNIKDTRISFTVPKQWMQLNNVETDNIHLQRYDGDKWNALETELTGQDEDFFIFEAKTPGFSPFAITAEIPDTAEEIISVIENNGIVAETEKDPEKVAESGSISTEVSQPELQQNSSFLLFISIFVVLFCRRRNIF